MGFFIRWICAFALLAATFNPTEYNYVQWVRSYGGMNISIAVLTGLLLLIGYIIYLRATLRSIGGFGMVLVLALVGAGIWVLYDLGILRLEDPSMNVWLGLGALSFVLAIGLSWSIVRCNIGQTLLSRNCATAALVRPKNGRFAFNPPVRLIRRHGFFPRNIQTETRPRISSRLISLLGAFFITLPRRKTTI